jgi:D-amino-acid dehydrogenase
MNDVIVIGGGIVGASAAYRLACQGAKVTLIDRQDQGYATGAGAGIISPGSSIKPPAAFFPLAYASGSYYHELIAQLQADGEQETGYETCCGLMIATNEEEAGRLPLVQKLYEERRAAGVVNLGEISLLDGRGAREVFPALGEVHGAIYTTAGGRVEARVLRATLVRAALKRGATMLNGSAELVVAGDRVTGVKVDGQTLTADHIIIAGGAWSNALGNVLGVNLPVYPQRGQIAHIEMKGQGAGRWPFLLGFHSHYMVTFGPDRVVAGATREDDAGYDYRMTAGGVHEVLHEALRIAPGLASGTLLEVRIGLRPYSPDHLPILGKAPGVQNVSLCTGHGASGLLLGPYSGAAVADQVLGKPVSVDLAPFAPERFLAP